MLLALLLDLLGKKIFWLYLSTISQDTLKFIFCQKKVMCYPFSSSTKFLSKSIRVNRFYDSAQIMEENVL